MWASINVVRSSGRRLWDSCAIRCTVELGYNEPGYNEHSVITNKTLDQIGYFSTQTKSVITNPGFNEQKWPVTSCSL